MFKKHTYGKYLGIAIKVEDKEHLEKFKKDIDANYEIKTYKSSGYSKDHITARLLICSNKLVEDLSKWDVIENKTFHEKFPKIPLYLQRHFIRGVFDGDGSVYLENRSKSLGVHICGSKDLLLGIVNYFEKLGCFKNIQKSRSIFDIHFTNTKALFVLNEMYRDSSIYLDRKYEIYKKYINM